MNTTRLDVASTHDFEMNQNVDFVDDLKQIAVCLKALLGNL